MNVYSLLQPILFKFDAEVTHDWVMKTMSCLSKNRRANQALFSAYGKAVPELPVRCMGLDFKTPVGLAAGLDKNASAVPAFSALGFAGLELGTVTPKPQLGNDKPRLFRLPEDQAIINQMGFNSQGVEQFLSNLQKPFVPCVLGINIGKNAITDIAEAHVDYVSAMQRVYKEADYISINISSPNTASLRELQNANYLDELLHKIKIAHEKCEKTHKKRIPLALKVAPDLNSDEIEVISELLLSYQFDGLIATNTSISRPKDLTDYNKKQKGGLSGQPIKDLSTECIRSFYRHLNGKVQIIGVGGIKTADDAWEKLIAGADYLQMYSQLIYEGPKVIAEIVSGLQQKLKKHGFDDVATAMTAMRERN